MDVDVLALRFAPKFANQRESPPADRQVPAIMFNATDLVDGFFVESRFILPIGPIRAQQTSSAVITKHLPMHPGKIGGALERK